MEDVGSSIMYKDFYMTGWSCRDVTVDDVNLIPIVSGENMTAYSEWLAQTDKPLALALRVEVDNADAATSGSWT